MTPRYSSILRTNRSPWERWWSPFPQARRQAAQKGWPIDREVALLIVHGVLHLAGYDHLDARTESDMQARERAALRLIPEVYPRGTAAG